MSCAADTMGMDAARTYWRECAFSIFGAVLLAHGGEFGLWIGSGIILALIASGFLIRISYLWFALVASLYPLDSVPNSIGIKEFLFVLAFTQR